MANSKEQKTRRMRAWRTVRSWRQEGSGHGDKKEQKKTMIKAWRTATVGAKD